MSDAAGFGQVMMRARLTREIGESECKQRNALSVKRPGLTLREGTQVTVLDTLEQGRAFLVEFGHKPDQKIWCRDEGPGAETGWERSARASQCGGSPI